MLFVELPMILLGHIAIHVSLINRLHSTAIPRPIIKILNGLWYVMMIGIPIALGCWYLQQVYAGTTITWTTPGALLPVSYAVLCSLASGWAIVDRIVTKRASQTTELLLTDRVSVVSMDRPLGGQPTYDPSTQWFARLPGNEILQLNIHEKRLVIPQVLQPLHGMRITHLSDLHLSGQYSREFYGEIVRQSNEWESDIVVITGDIVENMSCLGWIADTIGNLRSRLGVYFVLGNHELKIRDEALIRATLTDAGLIDAGKRWQTIDHRGCPIVIAGNELPWYRPAAEMQSCPQQIHGMRPLRIALAHSPDQLDWARRHQMDLMLAGHTHGGQIRFPGIGAILAPSRHGTRFASGTFYDAPTLMHVSRGIAGTRPLRWNCPPELARLVVVHPLRVEETATVSAPQAALRPKMMTKEATSACQTASAQGQPPHCPK